MLKQDIIISPDIFEEIDTSFRESEKDIDLKSYKANILLKKIILDKNGNIDKKYKEIINKATDIGKLKINSILKGFLDNNQIEFKESSNTTHTTNSINNIIFDLALLSNYKLINSNNAYLTLDRNRINNLNGIEILNIDEIIHPPSESKCMSLERTINIKRGHIFEFERIIGNYLADTKKIIFSDKFIRKRPESQQNIIKLLLCCKQLNEITIYTNTRKENDFIRVEELKNIIHKAIKIEPNIKPTGKHRRTIETDSFRIAIDPGLDFVNDKYIAEKNDIEINITTQTN